ncbi:MAG: PqqD family protein [Microcystaceae cyanobacterium]
MTLSMNPCKLKDLEEYPLGVEMLLYSADKAIGVSLNSSAMNIWQLCNGKHTLIEISQELGKIYEIESQELINQLLEDVKATVEQFSQLGILENSDVSQTTAK